ncbi:hypothetical protein J14TS2_53500 [Bacillus sp. J14TS2]|uniref:sensor histidine kinase n=1 Tax=Bacillus sp. J14TS2 TaxID=2807188 RepID=UPI001B0CA95F|nr:HAMP domain-containing sensor histidine kinase [Bacillus sp. J14TS2]GIN74875.1 hypothetical protein J14TS2_53500 [Bacillus sp. J14TS2]
MKSFFKRTEVSIFMILFIISLLGLIGIYYTLWFSTDRLLTEYKQKYFSEKAYQMSFFFRADLKDPLEASANRKRFEQMAQEYATPVEFVQEDTRQILYKNKLDYSKYNDPYVVELPIVKDGKTLGYLHAYYDMKEDLSSPAILRLEEELTHRRIYILIFASFLALIISLIIAKRYAEPMKISARYAEKILKGNREEFVPRVGTTETKQLIDSINNLLIEFNNVENWRKQMMEDLTHELRTPLTSVLARLEAIVDGVYPKTDKNLQDIYEEVERFSRLVSNVQQLSEAEGARFKLKIRKIYVTDLVRGVYEGFLFIAKQRKIKMHFNSPSMPCTAYIDPDRMIQVITNLLSNALKYTPPGGDVWVTIEILDDHFVFYCQDNGIGISEDELNLVFNRFYRIDKSRSRDYGGSGIGLSISKALVHAHGGQIGVESELEKGSIFWVEIPLDNQLVAIEGQSKNSEGIHEAI